MNIKKDLIDEEMLDIRIKHLEDKYLMIMMEISH